MDLIADVIQKADASKMKLATLKLSGLASKTIAKGMESDSKKIRSTFAVEYKKDQSRVPGFDAVENIARPSSAEASQKAAMRGLETILATKMVEGMMPKDQDELYGEGTAGNVWRGFHIEAMGKALADQRLFATSGDEDRKMLQPNERLGHVKVIVPFAG
jgi:peptidoglycan hydrolase FlgJ